MSRVAGRPHLHPDVARLQGELARAHIDLGHTQAELDAARDQLANEQSLTRDLRAVAALMPYNPAFVALSRLEEEPRGRTTRRQRPTPRGLVAAADPHRPRPHHR